MGDTEPFIREAVAADCDNIFRMLAGLAVAVGDTGKFVSTVDDLRQYGFGDSPLFQALVAERDQELLGLCLYFYTYSTWLGRPGIYVQDLFVADAERGSGLGRRLLQQVAAAGKERGANHLRLSVDHINSPAQIFYDALGFRHRDDEHIYQADGLVFDELAARSVAV